MLREGLLCLLTAVESWMAVLKSRMSNEVRIASSRRLKLDENEDIKGGGIRSSSRSLESGLAIAYPR